LLLSSFEVQVIVKPDYVEYLPTKLVEMTLSLLVVDRANFAPLGLGPIKGPFTVMRLQLLRAHEAQRDAI